MSNVLHCAKLGSYIFTMNHQILQLAARHGFDLAGISSVDIKPASFDHYQGWVTAGRAGEMAYMTRDPERRRSATNLLPGAQSVISLAINYYRPERPRLPQAAGQVARYAYGRDYHKIITKMLKRFINELKEQYPNESFRPYIDTGAILERSYAQQAGLGYIGKNTMLITPKFGSWVFLSEVLTSLELDPTPSTDPETCGHCRLCLDICPTGALVGAGELDARRCISYLTIEHRGSIPEELRPLMGDWLYGCDLCQEICPKNVVAQGGGPEALAVRIGGDHQFLSEVLELRTKEAFDERFAGSPIRRAKREGLLRNACVVAANVGAIELLSLLKNVARDDSSELVREHATWAVAQITAKN